MRSCHLSCCPRGAGSYIGGGRTNPYSLRTVYADPRFWRLAPLSAACIGTAWALQGLWAAPWLSDVERLDRSGLLWHLLIMAIALSLGGLLWGIAVDRARRRGIGPRPLLGLVATMFIAAQLALILRLPLPSYVPWIVVAAVGAGTVLSYAILAEYFPKELAGRANAALNLFHIGSAFVVQYMTGLVVQLWAPIDGHYPEVAYQAAFAFNVGLQIVAGDLVCRTQSVRRGIRKYSPSPARSAWDYAAFLKDRKSRRQAKSAPIHHLDSMPCPQPEYFGARSPAS